MYDVRPCSTLTNLLGVGNLATFSCFYAILQVVNSGRYFLFIFWLADTTATLHDKALYISFDLNLQSEFKRSTSIYINILNEIEDRMSLW